MSGRKQWQEQQDQLLINILTQYISKDRDGKISWVQISLKLNSLLKTNKNGKQCRERWKNHLDPSIRKTQQWSEIQINTLFTLQKRVGNRWALIAESLPGRTDNSAKNYFYSTLRKSLRKINDFVVKFRRESTKNKNIKFVKPSTINKIIAVCDEKKQGRILMGHQRVAEEGEQIKNELIDLQLLPKQFQNSKQIMLKLVHKITDFNRNCRRKKGKAAQDTEDKQVLVPISSKNKQKKIKQNVILAETMKTENMIEVQGENMIKVFVQGQNEPIAEDNQKVMHVKNEQIPFDKYLTSLFCQEIQDSYSESYEYIDFQQNLLSQNKQYRSKIFYENDDEYEENGQSEEILNLNDNMFKKLNIGDAKTNDLDWKSNLIFDKEQESFEQRINFFD